MKVDKEERLDKYIQEKTDLSRSFAQRMIEEGHILVNGELVKKNYKLRIHDEISIDLPEEPSVEPENIPLSIVYEDDHLAVIDKPRDMIVHPTDTIKTKTLVNALLYHYSSLYDDGSGRPGIVHRLDKDTTGLMLIAKTQECGERLKVMIQNRQLEKKYLAIVHGKLTEKQTIIQPIARDAIHRKRMCVAQDGRYAETIVTPVDVQKEYSLVEAQIITGRTHQIRVHMQYIGHPLLGDSLYGRRKEKIRCEFPMLHSYSLSFTHPMTNELMIQRRMPDSYFMEILDKCQLKKNL